MQKVCIFWLAVFTPLTTLKNGSLNWLYYNSAEEWGEAVSKTNVHIDVFEIDDAKLHGKYQRERILSIPCRSDPDLCIQFDVRDADTSMSAVLGGEHSILYHKHYDRQPDAWVTRLA